uniref:Uncharacterized protein n=1 Tax=Setaria digitata TaxID=48799 RepID=A0A915PW00_9BILA
MTSSTSSLLSSTREVIPPNEAPYHHECIELLIPENITNTIVISSVLEEMPPQARTIDRPVILTHASNRSNVQYDESGTKGKI